MAVDPLIHVIILTWNRLQDTLACLESLLATEYSNLRIVLVDNGSSDDTPAIVRTTFPTVTVVENGRNLGFAAGTNVGIRYALADETDFVFLLNNDTLVDRSLFQHLLGVIEPGVGMVAPKIYYADDPNRIWSVGAMKHPLTLERSGDGRNQLDAGQWDLVLDRDYLVGCALLISRQLLEEIGLFDEAFFVYYEDSDLTLRAREGGYRLLLAPQAKIWHRVSASSGGSDTPNERYWMAHSSVRFFCKHTRGWHWMIVVPFRMGSALKLTLRLLSRGNVTATTAYWRGLLDGLQAVARR